MDKKELHLVLSHLTCTLLTSKDSKESKSLKSVFDFLYSIWDYMNENDINSVEFSAVVDEKGNKI